MESELKEAVSSALEYYRLYFDGSVECPVEDIPDIIALGVDPKKIHTNGSSDDLSKFNRLSESFTIGAKDNLDFNELSKNWVIPEEFKNFDIAGYIFEDCFDRIKQDQFYEERLNRLYIELQEYEKRDLIPILSCLVHILAVFREKGVSWGVGRGSSCASYLLNVIGVHCVDPIKFGIPLNEFFRD